MSLPLRYVINLYTRGGVDRVAKPVNIFRFLKTFLKPFFFSSKKSLKIIQPKAKIVKITLRQLHRKVDTIFELLHPRERFVGVSGFKTDKSCDMFK